jgi:hypothetical protein
VTGYIPHRHFIHTQNPLDQVAYGEYATNHALLGRNVLFETDPTIATRSAKSQAVFGCLIVY